MASVVDLLPFERLGRCSVRLAVRAPQPVYLSLGGQSVALILYKVNM